MRGYEYYKKAKAYAEEDDIKSMVECLQKAIPGKEGDPFAAPILARVYIQAALQSAAGFLEQFIRDMEDLEFAGFDSEREQYELGCIYTLLGREIDAEEFLYDDPFTLEGLAKSINTWREDF